MPPSPRPAALGDLASLNDLMMHAFSKPLVEEFPQLFAEENLPHCRVVEQDGKIVTNAGMLVDRISIFGCGLTVACVGAVATHEEYRGRGYAGACFAELVEHARALGCDVMLVSGSRSLYLRAGCRLVGIDFDVEMSRERAHDLCDDSIAVRRATPDDIPTMDALHRQEALHWDRRTVTWEDAFREQTWNVRWGWEVWVASQDGVDVGYFAADVPRDRERVARATEFAGNRELVTKAFAAYAWAQRDGGIVWKLSGADEAGRRVAEDSELAVAPAMSLGTVLVTNLPQLMERLRPYLARRIGDAAASALRFAEHGDGASVTLGAESLHLPSAPCVAQFGFGTREERPTPPPTSGRLGEVYRAAFPVPTPEYGLNFV